MAITWKAIQAGESVRYMELHQSSYTIIVCEVVQLRHCTPCIATDKLETQNTESVASRVGWIEKGERKCRNDNGVDLVTSTKLSYMPSPVSAIGLVIFGGSVVLVFIQATQAHSA